jgi:hypothetical protein
MQSVVRLSVVIFCYAECQYAGCRYADSRGPHGKAKWPVPSTYYDHHILTIASDACTINFS